MARVLGQTITAIRPYALVAAALFLAGAVVGMMFPGISLSRLASLKLIAESMRDMPARELVLLIFAKNMTASAVSIFLGAMFGFLPVLSAITNGVLLGGVVLLDPGELWRIIPHGIFELPAMFIAWGMGIWIGMWFRDDHALAALRVRFTYSALTFLLIVTPLLFIAAVIEGLAVARFWSQ